MSVDIVTLLYVGSSPLSSQMEDTIVVGTRTCSHRCATTFIFLSLFLLFFLYFYFVFIFRFLFFFSFSFIFLRDNVTTSM